MIRAKKSAFLFLVICCLTVFSLILGCETAKGAARGVGDGVAYTSKGIAKDTAGTIAAIQRLDNWIKRNLW